MGLFGKEKKGSGTLQAFKCKCVCVCLRIFAFILLLLKVVVCIIVRWKSEVLFVANLPFACFSDWSDWIMKRFLRG